MLDKRMLLHKKEMIDDCISYLDNTDAEAFDRDHIRGIARMVADKDKMLFLKELLLENAPERLLEFMQKIPGENFTDEQVAHLMALSSQIKEQYEDSLPTYKVKKSPFNEGTFGVVDREETEETDLEDYWVADKLTEEQAIAIAETLNREESNE